MLLNNQEIDRRLTLPHHEEGAIRVIPTPNLVLGEASISLRLGRWFRSYRASRSALLDISKDNDIEVDESRLTREYFIRFGNSFVLHPHKFVLGATLEWIKLPKDVGAYVTGKSSWARRGLIIETAAGVHPGFSGCLTLEMTNLGEVPIALFPGMEVCQIFMHRTEQASTQSKSRYSGARKPGLGRLRLDPVVQALKTEL